MADTDPETDDLKALALRSATWETAELIRATTVEASAYSPEYLAVFRRELHRRGATAVAPSPPAFSSFSPENDPLYGVGGWLVFMVLDIALRSVVSIVDAIRFGLNATTASLIVVAIDAPIAILGGFTCLVLLRKQRNADRIALCWYLLNAAVAGVLLTVTLAHGSGIGKSLGGLGYSLLWITYLRTSERVKVTYRSPRPPAVEAFN